MNHGKSWKRLRFGVLLVLGALGAASCGPKLVLSTDPNNPSLIRFVPYNMGDVDVSTENYPVVKEDHVLVHNSGTGDAIIDDISPQALGVTAPFSLNDSGNPWLGFAACSSGMKLAAGETCHVPLRFQAFTLGSFEMVLKLTYRDTSGSPPINIFPFSLFSSPQPSLTILARSVLNCNTDPKFIEKFGEGVAEANAQIERDREQGRIDGEALTREDGIRDAYQVNYDEAYDLAYNGPNGYPRGRAQGYTEGQNQAQGNPHFCQDGSNDGYEEGLADGEEDGQADGYEDGKAEGYVVGRTQGRNEGLAQGYDDGDEEGYDLGRYEGQQDGSADGFEEGYDDGHDDGVDACFFARVKGSAPAALIDDLAQGCYTKGFDQTYNTDAYMDAYDDARDRNLAYQQGLAEGGSDGKEQGKAEGEHDGYEAGLRQGRLDGYAAGSDEEYAQCFNQAYGIGYDRGYEDASELYNSIGYLDGYDDGYHETYPAAYNEGHDNGHDHGYAQGRNSTYGPAFDIAYDEGYDEGFDDGFDSCSGGGKVKRADRMAKAKAPDDVRARVKGKVAGLFDRHPVPARQIIRLPDIQRMTKTSRVPPPVQGHLPEMMARLAPSGKLAEAEKIFFSRRDRKDGLSLRNYVRRNKTALRNKLGTVHKLKEHRK